MGSTADVGGGDGGDGGGGRNGGDGGDGRPRIARKGRVGRTNDERGRIRKRKNFWKEKEKLGCNKLKHSNIYDVGIYYFFSFLSSFFFPVGLKLKKKSFPVFTKFTKRVVF